MQLYSRPLAPGETDAELLWLCVSLGGLVAASIWLWLELPWPICVFHDFTGYPCLTCGATRAGVAFFHGHLKDALKWNPLITVGYCALTLFDCYAAVAVVLRLPRLRFLPLNISEKKVIRWVMIGVLFVNWGYLLTVNRPS